MFLLGIIQSIVGFFVFLLRKPVHRSNLILAIWLLIIALILVGGTVEGGLVKYFKPGVFPLVFLFGPLLYFYILSQISSDFVFRLKHVLHLLPFLGIMIHRIFYQPGNIDFIDLGANNMNLAIYQVLMLISIVVYWISGIILLVRHHKKIPENFSYRSERLTLNWTWLIVFLNILIFVLMFLSPFLGAFFKDIDSWWLYHFNFALFAFLLTVFGLIQPVIYNNQAELSDKKINNPLTSAKKYIRSGLSGQEMEEIIQKINAYFKSSKPHLQPEFDLQKMSADLKIPRQNLSQAINEKLNKNFYRLVNENRVEEVIYKMNLETYQNFSLLGIAFESGFNSKASFNRVFKEITGKTPSDYKES